MWFKVSHDIFSGFRPEYSHNVLGFFFLFLFVCLHTVNFRNKYKGEHPKLAFGLFFLEWYKKCFFKKKWNKYCPPYFSPSHFKQVILFSNQWHVRTYIFISVFLLDYWLCVFYISFCFFCWTYTFFSIDKRWIIITPM